MGIGGCPGRTEKTDARRPAPAPAPGPFLSRSRSRSSVAPRSRSRLALFHQQNTHQNVCVTSEWLTVSCVIHDIRRRHRIARPDSGRTATNYAPARPGPPPLLATTSDATLPYLSSHISGLWRSPTIGAAPLSGRRSHRPRDTLPIRHSIHPHCLPSGASSRTRVHTFQ